MIAHIVLLSLADDAGDELADVMARLDDVCAQMQGAGGFCHGPNHDFEKLSPDCDYGFMAMFENAAALAAYADDEMHRALGARLIALCRGGKAGLQVIDLEV